MNYIFVLVNTKTTYQKIFFYLLYPYQNFLICLRASAVEMEAAIATFKDLVLGDIGIFNLFFNISVNIFWHSFTLSSQKNYIIIFKLKFKQ